MDLKMFNKEKFAKLMFKLKTPVMIELDNHLEIWEKLKQLEPYEDSSSLHIAEERYEIDGVKYIVSWEISSDSQIPHIAILKE